MSKTAFLKQKNALHFISMTVLVLEIFKFKNFRILNLKTSSNAYAWNKKCILLNNLGGKHSLVMKFLRDVIKKSFVKVFYKNVGFQTVCNPRSKPYFLTTHPFFSFNLKLKEKLLILDILILICTNFYTMFLLNKLSI